MIASDQADLGNVRVLLFDVFGTVVDWRTSIIAQLQAFGDQRDLSVDWTEFADRWRACYQPSLEEVRSGIRPWTPLGVLHRESLSDLLAEYGVGPVDPVELDALNMAWHRLEPWPDVVPAFPLLARRADVVSLSNADSVMSADIANHAGISWDAIMGAGPARAYKPQPEVFLHALDAMNVRPEEAMMVAAHNRDLHSAAQLGIRTALVIRPTEHGPGQFTDLGPTGPWDIVCSDLLKLAIAMTPAPERRADPEHNPGVVTDTEDHLPKLGRTDLTRARLMTIAAVIAVAVALAFDQGHAAGVRAGIGQERNATALTITTIVDDGDATDPQIGGQP